MVANRHKGKYVWDNSWCWLLSKCKRQGTVCGWCSYENRDDRIELNSKWGRETQVVYFSALGQFKTQLTEGLTSNNLSRTS
ncbi:MAG: DUF3078 domain-containing protein [Flavobacteriales bacterium]|nr:DUF3078 domain-containing protein [Flavobacteriales bacterium]